MRSQKQRSNITQAEMRGQGRRQQVVKNAPSSVTVLHPHTLKQRQIGPVPDIKVKPPGSTTPAGVFSNVPLVVVVVEGCQEAEFVCTWRDPEDVEIEEDDRGVLPDRLDTVKGGLTRSWKERRRSKPECQELTSCTSFDLQEILSLHSPSYLCEIRIAFRFGHLIAEVSLLKACGAHPLIGRRV